MVETVTMRTWIFAAVALGAGCPQKTHEPVAPPSDPYPGREQSLMGLLRRDLEVEVLEGYDLPTFETAVPATAVSSRVGAVHIGVGPDDVTAGVVTSVDRWPLLPVDDIGARLDHVESKRLEMHLARDLTAAWTFDEISYRIPGCLGKDGQYKETVIPLRMTSLYVRDGERWVSVLEHISYPQRTADLVERAGKVAVGKHLRNGEDLRPEIKAPLQAVVRAIDPALSPADRAALFSADDDALALWPDPNDELRQGAILDAATLATTFDAAKIKLESWRVAMSPDPTGGVGAGSVAWVAGTLLVDARRPRGDDVENVTLRLRATFVLEKRDGRWQIVQSDVSAPIDDDALLRAVLGDSGGGDTQPWQRTCEGQWTVKSAATPP